MLLFLSLADSDKEAPNENYARELMELFTLGRGYSERDIRQASRALTGFQADWRDDGTVTLLLRRARARRRRQAGARQGRALRLEGRARPVRAPPRPRAVHGRQALGVLRRPPSGGHARAAVRVYRRSGLRIRPVVGAILAHPALYRNLDAPTMVKSPVVFVAGALRSDRPGHRPRRLDLAARGHGPAPVPPAVGRRLGLGHAWLSSNSMRVRFDFANYLLDTPRVGVEDGSTPERLSPRKALARPPRPSATRGSRAHRAELLRWPAACSASEDGATEERADMCQRVLRHLLLSGPDAQVH